MKPSPPNSQMCLRRRGVSSDGPTTNGSEMTKPATNPAGRLEVNAAPVRSAPNGTASAQSASNAWAKIGLGGRQRALSSRHPPRGASATRAPPFMPR